jgi:hypothetical protein
MTQRRAAADTKPISSGVKSSWGTVLSVGTNTQHREIQRYQSRTLERGEKHYERMTGTQEEIRSYVWLYIRCLMWRVICGNHSKVILLFESNFIFCILLMSLYIITYIIPVIVTVPLESIQTHELFPHVVMVTAVF